MGLQDKSRSLSGKRTKQPFAESNQRAGSAEPRPSGVKFLTNPTYKWATTNSTQVGAYFQITIHQEDGSVETLQDMLCVGHVPNFDGVEKQVALILARTVERGKGRDGDAVIEWSSQNGKYSFKKLVETDSIIVIPISAMNVNWERIQGSKVDAGLQFSK